MKKREGSNKGFQPVGDAIRDMLSKFRIESKFDEANVLNSWERLVGKPIAKRTRKVFIRNRVLFAEFDSPSIKQDFNLHKAEVLGMFQKEFGEAIIAEIVVL